MRSSDEYQAEIERLKARRRFIAMAAAGTMVTAIGGAAYILLTREPKALRNDGKPRLPPGQREATKADSAAAAQQQPAKSDSAQPQPAQDKTAKSADPDAVESAEQRRQPAETPADSPIPKPTRYDGRPTDRDRTPPHQTARATLKPMGGAEGDPSYKNFRLRVHGEVESPFELTFDQLIRLPQTDLTCDVHCVTGWSMLDSRWLGVRVKDLAKKAGLKSTARHVVFECAHGYTANVPLEEALAPNVIVAHEHGGELLAHPHGGPLRSLVPDLYFWKSAKWLTGVRFTERDEPGYWEVRGYHNHGDPWLEERYS
jgi:hypothetical protein